MGRGIEGRRYRKSEREEGNKGGSEKGNRGK